MKKNLYLVVVLVLFGCKKDPEPVDLCLDSTQESINECVTEVSVASETCILQEIMRGDMLEKFVYTHDGEHYTQIQVFEDKVNGQFTDTPKWIIDLEYDNLDRVIRETYSYPDIPQQSVVTTFNFDQPMVTIQTVITTPDNPEQQFEWDQFYYPDSPDSVYELDFRETQGANGYYLMEYINGNRNRVAQPDNSGECDIYEGRWSFIDKSYYDDRPNVLSDYAVRFPLNGNSVPAYTQQFWYQENENNLLGHVNPSSGSGPTAYCWSFLVSPMGKYWVKEFENLTYVYDCE